MDGNQLGDKAIQPICGILALLDDKSLKIINKNLTTNDILLKDALKENKLKGYQANYYNLDLRKDSVMKWHLDAQQI